MDIEKKLKELNIKLPNAPEPVGAYVAFKGLINCFLYQVNFQSTWMER